MRKFVMFLFILLLVLAACAMPDEAELLPPMVDEPREHSLWVVPVLRGDISYDSSILAAHAPASTANQSFVFANTPILEVFIAVGDRVEQGDVLASLSIPEVQSQFDNLSQRQRDILFEIELTNERRQLAESLGRPVASYDALLANLNFEYDFNAELFEYVTALNEERYLRASKDGVVTRINFAQGETPNRMTFAVIANVAFPYFLVEDDFALQMAVGDRFRMNIGADFFDVEVIDPIVLGLPFDEGAQAGAFLVFADTVASPPRLTSASVGRIIIYTEVVEDVIHVPNFLIHQRDGRDFVYVVEDGFVSLRYVDIGFVGAAYTEIVNGLTEGELILRD